MDGNSSWEKCKLLLVKAAGGHMLQFYAPPKVFLHLYYTNYCLLSSGTEVVPQIDKLRK